MKEQELDRLREQIFRFQAAQEREQTAKQQYMQTQKQEERRKKQEWKRFVSVHRSRNTSTENGC